MGCKCYLQTTSNIYYGERSDRPPKSIGKRPRSCYYTWITYWIAAVVFLSEINQCSAQWKRCPKECMCSSSWLRGVTSVVVDCSKRGLHHIPVEGVPSDVTSFVLNENFIQHVPRDAFKGYRYLRELYLYKNFISKVDREAFKGLRRLQVLSLHTNRLRKLENGTFHGLGRLRRLYLFSNFLEEMDTFTFDGIGGLTTLFLHENHLRTLIQDTFSSLINLQVLTLYRNYLTELHRGAFRGLDALAQLYMHQNKINYISKFAFEGCKKLRKITLGNNLLTNLTKGAFLGLPWMQELYLDKNKIKVIEEESFIGMFGLRKLALQSNQVNTIKQGAFSGLRGLLVLSLADNDIKFIQAGMFSGLKYLRQLYLYRNKLQVLDTGTFKGLRSLLELNLGVNNISSIENGAFDGLIRLQMLLLNSNRLRIVTSGAFKSLPLLRKLYLYLNEISYVDEGAFAPLVDIDEIAWYPPKVLLRARPQLAKILSNRLQCDCNALWLRNWLEENDHVNVKMLCHEPNKTKHRMNVTDVPKKDFICDTPSRIQISPDSPTVEVGKKIELNCFMEPGGLIRWIRNGSIVHTNSSEGILVTSSGLLSIEHITKNDHGEYVCMVANKAAVLATSVKLQIGVPPRIIRRPEPVVTVESPGQSVVLECEAIGSPAPLITWSQGGFPIRDGFDKFISHRGDLIILSMKVQDQGIYQCEVWNELGRASVAVQLYLGQGTKCLPSCLYGGFCMAKYICQCLPTFTGEYCETRITDAVIPSLSNTSLTDMQTTDEDQASGWLDSFTTSIESGDAEEKPENKNQESGHDVDNRVGLWNERDNDRDGQSSKSKKERDKYPYAEEQGFPAKKKQKVAIERRGNGTTISTTPRTTITNASAIAPTSGWRRTTQAYSSTATTAPPTPETVTNPRSLN